MPDKVIAISSKDGRNSMIFHSIKECAEHFGQTEKYIKYLIDSGEKYKQFYFDFYEGEGVDVDRLFCKGNDNTDTDMSDGIVIAMKLVIMYRIETDAVVTYADDLLAVTEYQTDIDRIVRRILFGETVSHDITRHLFYTQTDQAARVLVHTVIHIEIDRFP